MENNQNRTFFLSCPTDAHKNKKDFACFKIRSPPEYHKRFENMGKIDLDGDAMLQELLKESNFVWGNDTIIALLNEVPVFTQKNTELDKDKVARYEFDTIPYDNTNAKDVVAYHHNIYTTMEDKDLLKGLISVICPTAKFSEKKYVSGMTITTQLYPPTPRGVWTTPEFSRQPRYPVCVLTYARANESGRTHKTLTEMGVPHSLFVEQSQLHQYLEWYDPSCCEIIPLPDDFRGWGTMGSTPVRNYILDWGLERGHKRVWMLDDNIKQYIRLYQGTKNKIISPTVFTHIEDYIDRYDNVGAVSHNFNPSITEGDMRACIVKNNKCYSSMCLLTDKEFRFRYKHQEDNLYSMEMIERGLCNLCFNSVLYDKNTSGQDQGGNKKTIYKCEEGKTDGSGYKERFEYFKMIVQILQMEGKITLIEGKTIDDLIQRDLRHKAHQYHANVHYEFLANHKKNDISHNNLGIFTSYTAPEYVLTPK